MRLKTIALASAALLCLADAALAQQVVGRNAAVKGTVTIESLDEAARAALVKDEVKLNDEVVSKTDSSLQVLLLDETVFTVGPDAVVSIDTFVYDPSRNNNGMKASVKRGMFRFMSGKTAKSGPNAVSIDTPVASLGVRGTIVEGLVGREAVALARRLGLVDPSVSVDPDGATLFVLRGPGPARVGRDRVGEIEVRSQGGTVVLDTPGQAVFIANRSAAPRRVTMLDLTPFDAKLRTTPSGGPSARPFDVTTDVPRETKPGQVPVAVPYDPVLDLDWPDEDIFDGDCGSFCEGP